jgi:hypothetical protein
MHAACCTKMQIKPLETKIGLHGANMVSNCPPIPLSFPGGGTQWRTKITMILHDNVKVSIYIWGLIATNCRDNLPQKGYLQHTPCGRHGTVGQADVDIPRLLHTCADKERWVCLPIRSHLHIVDWGVFAEHFEVGKRLLRQPVLLLPLDHCNNTTISHKFVLMCHRRGTSLSTPKRDHIIPCQVMR